jgi:transposase
MTQVSKSSMSSLSASSIDSVGSSALRSSTIGSSADRSPDPEVIQIATRRQFSASEKRILLAEADRCKERGELGAFLRRKRIYSSMLSSWRKQMGAADSAALAPKRRGPKPDAAAREIKHLNRDIVRLRRKLERAQLIIDAQKKLCVALGLPTADETSEDE